jgi:hypothetical protein
VEVALLVSSKKVLKTLFTLVLLLTIALAGCRKVEPPSVEVKWIAPAQSATYYEIFRSTHRGIYDVSKPYVPRFAGTSFVDSDVIEGETYFYRIRAVSEDSKGVHKSVLSEEVMAYVPER